MKLIGYTILALFCMQVDAATKWANFLSDEKVLYGCWKMVSLPKVMHNHIPWSEPYQFFYFQADHKVIAMRSTEPVEVNCEQFKKILKPIPRNVTWSYQKPLLSVRYTDLKGFDEKWGVNHVSQDQKQPTKFGTSIDFKKGDLIMTLDDGAGGVSYTQLLRRFD